MIDAITRSPGLGPRMCVVDGTWERGFTALVAQANANENLDWAVSVDSTIVQAHQHAAEVRKRGHVRRADDHAIDRSRGELTTRIHLTTDGR
ncbi:hypothetical protein ACF1AU_34490 [Streptomyces rubrogriseus]|uniref:hypothetical protein n=1 Tax=Streptomyces rubrogriseus TaxID=194673 RepID=UPI0036FE0B43